MHGISSRYFGQTNKELCTILREHYRLELVPLNDRFGSVAVAHYFITWAASNGQKQIIGTNYRTAASSRRSLV